MAEAITIIFDYPREEEFSFDVVFKEMRFEHYRKIKAGLKFVADMRATAERHGGYRWISNRKAFVTMHQVDGTEPQKIVKALERQGYIVRVVGAVECLDHKEAA